MQNAGVFVDLNTLRTMEGMRQSIAAFREQQEFLLLNVAPPSVATSAKVSSSGAPMPEDPSAPVDVPVLTPLTVRDRRALDARIFEHPVLIASLRRSRFAFGSWSLAMVGDPSTHGVYMGSFESFGSLWRLLRLDDSWGNVRAVLEWSEIGERPMYLTSKLEITENYSFAAEWLVSAYVSAEGAADSVAANAGVCVQLRSPDDQRVLCCCISDSKNTSSSVSGISSGSGGWLALLSDSDILEADSRGDALWNIAWELISEDAPVPLVSLEDVADFSMSLAPAGAGGDASWATVRGNKQGEYGGSSKGINAPVDFNMSFAGRLGKDAASTAAAAVGSGQAGSAKARSLNYHRSRYDDDEDDEFGDIAGGF